MSQAYSDPSRESDPHALPDIEVFELTAREVAEQDEDMIYEYMHALIGKTCGCMSCFCCAANYVMQREYKGFWNKPRAA